MNVILSDGSTAHFGPLQLDELDRHLQYSGFEGDLYRSIAALVLDETNRDIIRDGTPRHWRRCGGYNLDRFIDGSVSFRTQRDPRFNLARLVCGAEGTLAVMTDITLNLVPLPRQTALAIVHFDDLKTALEAVPIILETDPSAVELLDHLGLMLCRDVPQYARLLDTFIEGEPNCVLITEFYGSSDAELLSRIEYLNDHLGRQRAGAGAVVAALDSQHQENVWTVRKVGLGLLMSIKGDHKPIPFIEDAAVPPEHLANYVTRIEQFCNDLGTEVAYYAHASAGCVHIRPLVNTKAAAEIAKLPEITAFSVELLHGYGGSLSSEHGDGRARSWINEHFFGPDLYRLYRQVKHTFDPQNLLNPGSVVEAEPMTENLRYGKDYQVVPLELHLDFSEDLGFDRAVEMCNGAGICRKRTTGTMCPSFMVTREEEHSTRGRANALRAALSGRLPTSELTSERMYEVMDLCIGCKACKAECPSSVDMAKIKFEFLAQYHAANGTPMRDRLFGDIARLSRLSSGPTAPIAKPDHAEQGDASPHRKPVRDQSQTNPSALRTGTVHAMVRAASEAILRQTAGGIVQRHVCDLQLPEHRPGSDRSAGSSGFRGRAAGTPLLRASDDLQGSRQTGSCGGPTHGRAACPLRQARTAHRGPGTELPADAPRRIPLSPARPPARPPDCPTGGDVRGIHRRPRRSRPVVAPLH